MSNTRLRLAFASETMNGNHVSPVASFFWRAWGTSRFLRGRTDGSPTGPFLQAKAAGFPTLLHAHRLEGSR
jgi:hypothetical protein